jgi:hypothetical protein
MSDLPAFICFHRSEVASSESTAEMRAVCDFCKDGKTAHRVDQSMYARGTWWHEIGRHAAFTCYEPCRAWKLRDVLPAKVKLVKG